ncbi:MAG: NAD+ synthase [Phycisphaerae bacterium]|nr:NAD+ synthase [Phycisphaerae bacterium]|tara:strand:- start:2377 stop:4077 length:1701 start_codon:yes stop_codon:yes gene_type:complete
MRIALAQLDPVIGDLDANVDAILAAVAEAHAASADVLLCAELAVCGYPPRDLLLREGFVEACERAVHRIAIESGDCCTIVGAPRRLESGGLANSAFVCRDGAVQAVADKQLLPGYDVFDEDRYFRPGQRACECRLDGVHLGVLLCEDAWQARDIGGDPDRYPVNPVADLAAAGVELLLVPSASPFVVGKHARHASELVRLASRHELSVAVVNQRGANDDLIFNGEAFVVDAQGRTRFARGEFDSRRSTIDVIDLDDAAEVEVAELVDDEARSRALVESVDGYVRKTGHSEIVIGLSGGIDSALAATIAAAAIGGERVTGVLMPSRFSSQGSLDDARSLAANLGLGDVLELPIGALHDEVLRSLGDQDATGVTDQNIQARLRGLLLMAIANERGALVVATGNKSELGVGYSTLYGDMNGALAVLGDIYKTDAYSMAEWINANPESIGLASPPIPVESITKPPSAELAEDQLDEDSLPPYEVLDDVLRRLVDDERSVAEVITDVDHEPAIVHRIARMLDLAQFKREQAAVIPKTTPRAFGRGRPWPIVSRDGSRIQEQAARPSPDPSL